MAIVQILEVVMKTVQRQIVRLPEIQVDIAIVVTAKCLVTVW